MKLSVKCNVEAYLKGLIFGAVMSMNAGVMAMDSNEDFPIVQSSFQASKYERVLMTQLRDQKSPTEKFREAANRLTELLVHRVIECLPTFPVNIETPIEPFQGERLVGNVEFVSIMRSGDALLDTFSKHFPDSVINKILVQRNEETAEPEFKYMKLSPTIAKCNTVVITEPMIATGGTLIMVIGLLKEKGVAEENIIVASVLAAPEGLIVLNQLFPRIKVVVTAIDEKLNDKKFIVPGLGDFGNRYFGT
ncbi:MAG: uracil phosphoribosyltransferase [Parachlamydiaceae bacterium]|nr:uracil phosphoribosyltransferase [Parachlamydiaceae bacterium]